MLKTILHILIILAVISLVAGGIYLLVQNSGNSLLGGANFEGDFRPGNGFRPEGGNFDKGYLPAGGQRPVGADFDHDGGGSRFFGFGLSQLGVNVGKVALITIGVILVQGLIRFFRRRKNAVDPSAS